MELEAVFLGIFSLISSIISRGMASTNSTIAFSSGVGHHLARISRIRITLETSLQCPQDFKIHRHYLDNLTSWAAQSGILVGNNYTLENVKDGIDIQIPAGADFSVENVFSNFTCNGSDVKVKNDLPEAPSPLSNLFKNFDNLSNALTDFFKLSILTSPRSSDEQHLQHNLSGTGVGDTARRRQSEGKKLEKGLIDTIISSLGIEVHLPNYSWCGPGTRVAERLANGDPGLNTLDTFCKIHDLIYTDQNNDFERRRQADEELQQRAWSRFNSMDASFAEKAAAYIVTNAMRAKLVMD